MNNLQKLQEILSKSIGLGKLTFGEIAAALAAILLTVLAAKIISNIVKKAVNKSQTTKTVKNIAVSVVKILIYVLGIMIVAECLGIPLTSVIALFSVLGLSLSLAAQDFLTGLIGGLNLLLTKPFNEQDFIEVDGKSGTVDKIDLIYTTLLTVDNKSVKIPNSIVVKADIINYTRQDKRRVEINVGVSYDCKPEDVKSSLVRAVDKTDKILIEEGILTALKAFEDSSMKYIIRVWCKTDDYWDVYYALMENIKKCFDEDGIVIPYNYINVLLPDSLQEGNKE